MNNGESSVSVSVREGINAAGAGIKQHSNSSKEVDSAHSSATPAKHLPGDEIEAPHPFGPCLCGAHSTVEVERRCWPGQNKPGGVGRIKKRSVVMRDFGPETRFVVAYIMGGTEKNVQATYVTCVTGEEVQRERKERTLFTVGEVERRKEPSPSPRLSTSARPSSARGTTKMKKSKLVLIPSSNILEGDGPSKKKKKQKSGGEMSISGSGVDRGSSSSGGRDVAASALGGREDGSNGCVATVSGKAKVKVKVKAKAKVLPSGGGVRGTGKGAKRSLSGDKENAMGKQRTGTAGRKHLTPLGGSFLSEQPKEMMVVDLMDNIPDPVEQTTLPTIDKSRMVQFKKSVMEVLQKGVECMDKEKLVMRINASLPLCEAHFGDVEAGAALMQMDNDNHIFVSDTGEVHII